MWRNFEWGNGPAAASYPLKHAQELEYDDDQDNRNENSDHVSIHCRPFPCVNSFARTAAQQKSNGRENQRRLRKTDGRSFPTGATLKSHRAGGH